MKIPRGVYPKETQEANIRRAAPAPWRNIPGAGETQGSASSGRALDGRPRAHVHQHTAEICGIECSGLPQGQKRDSPIARRFGGREQNFTGEVFWARGYFVSTVGLDETPFVSIIDNRPQTYLTPFTKRQIRRDDQRSLLLKMAEPLEFHFVEYQRFIS